MTLSRNLVLVAWPTCIVACGPTSEPTQEPYAPYTNLQVLPRDTKWADLEAHMLENLRGLGLRRTRGEGCLWCHEGSLDAPMETWDFASDAKLTKRKARVMMRMVMELNRDHLSQLEPRSAPPAERAEVILESR